jgi:hypothetical protein
VPKEAVDPFPRPSLSSQICPSIRFTNLITPCKRKKHYSYIYIWKKNLFKELSFDSANTGMPKTGRDYYSSWLYNLTKINM